jgi:hypothetical protein
MVAVPLCGLLTQEPGRLVGDLVINHHVIAVGPHPADRGEVAATADIACTSRPSSAHDGAQSNP